MPESNERKNISIDFDGVIHSYKSGWKGADKCPDPPVPGAIAFIIMAVERFNVSIYSSRNRYRPARHVGRQRQEGSPMREKGRKVDRGVCLPNDKRDMHDLLIGLNAGIGEPGGA